MDELIHQSTKNNEPLQLQKRYSRGDGESVGKSLSDRLGVSWTHCGIRSHHQEPCVGNATRGLANGSELNPTGS